MDGSYNNPYAHAHSPLSPDTPTNTFQINVNRKKTQKWVRAKVQNYDGDDWGTDEYDDDDEDDDEPEPPPQPVSRVTTGLRPVGPRLPSETRASPRVAAANAAAAAAASASSSQSNSGPPSLRVQTQQQALSQAQTGAPGSQTQTPASTGTPVRTVLPSMQSAAEHAATSTPSSATAPASGPVPAAASVPSRNASPAPVGARFPLRKSSVGQQHSPEAFQPAQLVSAASSTKSGHSFIGPRTASPAGRSTPDRSSPLVRPAEIHRRMEEERDKDRSASASPRPIPDNVSAKAGERSASPAETNKPNKTNRPPIQAERADSSGNAAPRMPSPLNKMAEHKANSGLDRFPRTSSPDSHQLYQRNPPSLLAQPSRPAQPNPHHRSETSKPNEATETSIEALDRHRLSISPQLPDVARMSLFGPDLFSSTVDFSDAPPVPAIVTRKEPPSEAPKQKETEQQTRRPLQTRQEPTRQQPPAQTAPISTPSPPPVASIVNSSPSPPPPSFPSSTTPGPAPEGLKSAMDASSSIYSRDAPSAPASDANVKDSVSPKPLSLASETQSQSGVSPLSDQNDHSARPSPNLMKQKPALYPVPDPRAIPPLRTPSPNTKGSVPVEDVHSESPQPSPSVAVSDISSSSRPAIQDITPTEPLQPRRPDDSPAEFHPKPIRPEPTISTTSSPVKESDVLTDEIMRSLSPVKTSATLAPLPDKDNRKSLLPGGRGDTRVSTYTLSDYDNYWADTTEKPQPETSKVSILPPPVPEPTKEPTKELIKEPIKEPTRSTTLPVNPPTPPPGPSTEPQNSRRRFSWEVDFEDNVKDLRVENPADVDKSSKAPIPSIKSPSSLGQSDAHSPTDAVSDITNPSNDASNSANPPNIIIPSGGISHQVSNASTAQPGNLRTSMLEPPSPVSVMSEQNVPPQSVEKRGNAILEEMKPKSPTPPPANLPRLVPTTSKSPPAPMQPVMTLRDIMALPTSSQRVARYEETRVAYSSMDSGLQDWVTAVKKEHPEHANVTSVFSGGAPASRHGHTPSSSMSNPSIQQPYYQQYLNASSPTTSAPASARSRLGKQSISSQPASAFSNSGDKIGTKSKEFMHSAGKMGKGLLSKGKSKLRSHGEKGEPIPPPVQQKVKSERRTSWGLSIGSKSRPDGPATHSSPDISAFNAPTHSHPNTSQYPQTIPVSPLDATFESSTPSRDSLLIETQGPRYVEDEPGEPSPIENERDESIKWEIPTPVSKDSTPWDPFRDTGLANDDDSDVDANSGVKLDAQEQTPKIGEPDVTKSLNNLPLASDPTAIPQQSSPQIRMVTPEPSSELSRDTVTQHKQPPASPPQDTYTASDDLTPRATTAARQIQLEEETPKRHSSFIGLPPIRRGSTFGLNPTRAARPVAERFSLDDEEEGEEPGHAPRIDKNEKGPAVHPAKLPADGEGAGQEEAVLSQDMPAPAPVPAIAPAAAPAIMRMDQQVAPKLQQPQWPRPHPPPLGMHPTTPTQLQGQFPGQQFTGQQLPGQQVPGQFPGQAAGQVAGQSSGQFPAQNMQFGRPPLVPPGLVGNPIQKLPPSGPWNLQESHLSEPLNPVTRNRAGTGSSHQAPQQEPFYGYDKETGITLPTPVSPAKQQKKISDVPPSSTRRYPELFSPPQQQPGYQRPQSNPVLPGQQFQGRPPRDGSFPRMGSNGQDVPSTGEERGRKKSSGLFKDFGSRFRRASTDRQSPFPEARPTGPRPDDASDSSMATEDFQDRKKRRSSFLLGRLGRPSHDLGSRPDLTEDSGQEQASTGAPLNPQNERKHSLFGAGLASQLKMKTSGPPKSSTSSLVNEPGSANNHFPPPSMKKRFSGFGSKAGVFHRPSMDHVQKPGTSHSIRSVASGQPPESQGGMGPPPSMPPQNMPRTGPIPVGPQAVPRQGTPEAEAAEKRKRRVSTAGLLSGLLGREPSPKPRDQHHAWPQYQPQPQPQPQPQFQHHGQVQPRPQPQSQPQVQIQPQPHPLQSHPHQSQQQPQPQPQVQPQVQPPVQPQGPPQGQPQRQPSPISTPSEVRQPMLRRMTGSSSLLDSPNQASPDRASMGRGLSSPELSRVSTDPTIGPATPKKQSSPTSMHQPRPSPLGPGTPVMRTESSTPQILTGSPKPPNSQIFTGSPKPPRATSYTGSPKLPKSSSLAGSPKPSNVGPALSNDSQTRIVSSPPDLQMHSTQPPTHQAPGDAPTRSTDFAVQPGVEPRDLQKVGFSPELTRRTEGVALSSRTTSVNQDQPQSPVSQISRTGPPSIASSGRGQSPHLGAGVTAMSSQGGRGFSQPTSPALSTAPTVSSMQPQSFGTRMSVVPQQQPPQQLQQQQQPPPPAQAVQQRQQLSPPQSSPRMGPPQTGPQVGSPRVGPQAGHQMPIQGQPGQGPPQQQQPIGRPFPGHTPQTSPHPSRSSMQMQPSFPHQGPPRAGLTPHGQGLPPMAQPPRQDSPGSKWKGLRSRMSGQAHSSQSHGKPPGHEKTGSKLFSAFKRSSKHSEPPPSQGFPPQMQQRPSWQQAQQPPYQQQQQQQPPPQFVRQPPYAQGQQQQLSPPMPNPPMQQGPYLQARTPSYNIGQLPPQGQPAPPGQLVPPQGLPATSPRQPAMDPRQAPPRSTQGFQDPLQRQRPTQQFQEQQYDQVPIPKGYAPVHGEGQVVPTAYNLGRGIGQSYHAQQTYTGQPTVYRPQQQANSGMLPRQVSSPVVPQQQQVPPLGDRSFSEGPRLSQAGQGGYISPSLRGQSFEVNQQPRPGVPRMQSDHSSHHSRLNMSPKSSAIPPQDPASVDSKDEAAPAPQNTIPDTRPNGQSLSPPRPPPSVASLGTTSVAPTDVSREPLSRDVGAVVAPTGHGLQQEEARPGVSNNAPSGHDKASPPDSKEHSRPATIDNPTSGEDEADKKKNNLEREPSPKVDVAEGKAIISQSDESDESSDEDEESRRASAVRSPAQKEDTRAELEDTEEAHKRKLRLAAQEEKIHFDPNADSDGEVPPQMSATSYPGQEWNPYGMEYGEWD